MTQLSTAFAAELISKLTEDECETIGRLVWWIRHPGFVAEYKATIPAGADCLPYEELKKLVDKWEGVYDT